jgi:thymidine phosphorylase
VESIPLIASSIMSKKIAESAGALVLDVKVGSGAFMKNLSAATDLAHALVEIGTQHGVKCSALLTDMSTPLGRAVGNANEVAESVDVLKGGGPADVVELTVALAREMLTLGGITDVDPAQVLASGAAYEKWAEMIRAQGGDPEAPLPTAKHVHVVAAPTAGTLAHLDAYAVGVAAWRLGAGRARKEDPVQHAAGIICRTKPGEPVEAGQPILELHTDTPDAIPAALSALDGQWSVGPDDVPAGARVLDIIRGTA